jgi:ABC-type phosphate/phosphonate transport system substrate-binding protein
MIVRRRPQCIDPQSARTRLEACRRRGAARPGFILLVMLACAIVTTVRMSGQPQGNLKKDIALGFSQSLFVEQDLRDATAALEIYAEEFSKKVGQKSTAKISLYDNLPSYIDAVRKGECTVACMGVMDYFRMKNECTLEPAIVPTSRGGFLEDRIVIVHKDAGIRDLLMLKNKSIAFSKGTRSEITMKWLTVELHRLKERQSNAYLTRTTLTKNEEQAVMSVFFRQTDAAIVMSKTLETMMEQNPQLKRDLAIIARSPGYIFSIVCFAPGMDEHQKRNVRDASLTMSNVQSGKQILRLFRYDGAKLFDPSDISSALELEQQYQQIQKMTGKKKR